VKPNPAEERSRVLIVDDDESTRLLISAALGAEDFELFEAESGEAALRTCATVAPHIVLLDVMMPGSDGYATCRSLRGQLENPDVLVLMVTGRDDQEAIQLAYDAGATDFISKPINYVILRHRVRYMLRAFRDRKAAEAQVTRLAYYDELTGLPNRAYLRRHLGNLVEQTKRRGQCGAVVSLDLDGFKRVNDTLGHAAGDLLLGLVAQRIAGCFGEGGPASRASVVEAPVDLLAKLPGDEYVAVLAGLFDSEDAVRFGERVREHLAEPFSIGDDEVFVTVSVGIAPFPAAEEAPEHLLRNADAAMYDAKREGGNRLELYRDELGKKARQKLEIENSLRRALDRNEFELFYQPKVNCRDGVVVVGTEALIRWRRPGHGLVPPLDFIPIAEKTGLIVPIGAWALITACRQTVEWMEQGLPKLSIAVNISARQVRTQELTSQVRAALSRTGLPPELLELEITEGILMEDVKLAGRVLGELRDLGVRVAIDDFGTGYSSLGYLRNLPVDTLKVDRSFVRDVTTNQDSAAIATAILAMSKSLRLNVVAEGVETQEQLDFLIEHECPEVQGFFFSKPLPSAEFVEWLRGRGAALKPRSAPIPGKSVARAI
jgi:diguanylate cyclase (GGDEF)-like protein